MTSQPNDRITLKDVDLSKPTVEWKHRLADYGRRRHLSFSMDFDFRARLLEQDTSGFSPKAQRRHSESIERFKLGLVREFGGDNIERKVADFIALGVKPISIVAYHNQFFHQARQAFILGSYYPALVSACALGERILNHLILDLRSYFKNTREYRLVYRKSSFDDWRVPIETLSAWNVLRAEAVTQFWALMKLRHRSIHFNASTYTTVREDALAALGHLREIIDQQFTSFGDRPWFIAGTLGQVFIKREWEEDPFVKTYYLPNCPFVGPYFLISLEHGLVYCDHDDYGDGDWSDEEFAASYQSRSDEQLAKMPQGYMAQSPRQNSFDVTCDAYRYPSR